MIIAVLFVIDVKICKQLFSFRGVKINFLLNETVNIFIVDSDIECVLLRFIVDLNFFERSLVSDGNSKRENLVSGVSLLGSDYMLANCQLGKL